jgi:hypothetical protein
MLGLNVNLLLDLKVTGQIVMTHCKYVCTFSLYNMATRQAFKERKAFFGRLGLVQSVAYMTPWNCPSWEANNHLDTEEISTSYGARSFITMRTKNRYQSFSWAG